MCISLKSIINHINTYELVKNCIPVNYKQYITNTISQDVESFILVGARQLVLEV